MKKIILIAALTVAAIIMILFIFNLNKGKEEARDNKSSPVTSSGLLTQAKALEAQNKLYDAKVIYQRLISEFPNSGEVMNWQKKAEHLSIKLLFSPTITPGSVSYEVKSGDTLTKIAKEFKTTVELIKKSNNIPDDRIIPGRKIKVWTMPITILVDKSHNTLLLKSNEEVIKTYIVSTGKNNSSPVGTFKIVNKLPNPTWFKAGAVVAPESPENVLGTRWLGFDLSGYGIHGTTEPQSLGKQVTQGCVRMANPEVEELYIITPVGTEVTVVD